MELMNKWINAFDRGTKQEREQTINDMYNYYCLSNKATSNQIIPEFFVRPMMAMVKEINDFTVLFQIVAIVAEHRNKTRVQVSVYVKSGAVKALMIMLCRACDPLAEYNQYKPQIAAHCVETLCYWLQTTTISFSPKYIEPMMGALYTVLLTASGVDTILAVITLSSLFLPESNYMVCLETMLHCSSMFVTMVVKLLYSENHELLVRGCDMLRVFCFEKVIAPANWEVGLALLRLLRHPMHRIATKVMETMSRLILRDKSWTAAFEQGGLQKWTRFLDEPWDELVVAACSLLRDYLYFCDVKPIADVRDVEKLVTLIRHNKGKGVAHNAFGALAEMIICGFGYASIENSLDDQVRRMTYALGKLAYVDENEILLYRMSDNPRAIMFRKNARIVVKCIHDPLWNQDSKEM